MSYYPVVGDILEARFYGGCNNQFAVNVTHWNVFAVSALGNITQGIIAGALDNLVAPLYKPMIASTAGWYGTSVQKIWPLPKPTFEAVLLNAGPGTGSNVVLPTQTRGVLSLKTPLAGQAHRGRMYLFFPPDFATTPQGHPTAAYIALGASLGTVFTIPFTVTSGGNTLSLQPVLFNRTTHTTQAIVSAHVTGKWGTQKKSGDYGRANLAPF